MIREWIRNFTKKHELPTFHPHQFRHTSISLQLQSGISVPDIAKRAGHARPDVTLNQYSHMFQEAQARTSQAIADALSFDDKTRGSNCIRFPALKSQRF